MKSFLIVIAVIGTCSANVISEDIHKAMEKVMRKYNELGLNLHGDPSSDSEVRVSDPLCKCVGYDCGCCAHLDIPKLHIDDQGCVNVTYLPQQYGISLTFSIDGKIYYNETVSASNPPPICFGIPYLEKEASLCVDIYNINYTASNFGGCVKLEARLYHVLVQNINLGCFHIPLSKKHFTMLKLKGLWEGLKKKTEDFKEDLKGKGKGLDDDLKELFGGKVDEKAKMEEVKEHLKRVLGMNIKDAAKAEDVKENVKEVIGLAERVKDKMGEDLELDEKWVKKGLDQSKVKIEKMMRRFKLGML